MVTNKLILSIENFAFVPFHGMCGNIVGRYFTDVIVVKKDLDQQLDYTLSFN